MMWHCRRDVAQFEDVIALRSLGAAEATIAAEKQGSHGSFFLPGNRNLAAEEEADFAHSIDPPTSRDPVGGERGFSSLVIKTTGS